MGKICIVRGFAERTSNKGSFVNAHEDRLVGEKVMLDGYHPGYMHSGRNIQHFFSTSPTRAKLQRLLPYFLYRRVVESKRNSPSMVLDALDAFFQQHNVDVVLAEFGNVGADICQYTTQLGIPLIVHFHGHDAHRVSVTDEYRERYQKMFAEAHRIVAVSKYMQNALIDLGADPERITLNPYGPNERFYDNTPEFHQTLVSIGRFTDIKAPHLTLLAFHQALQSCPEATLVMGGHGELLEACQTLAMTLGITDRVRFPGSLNHEEVVSHMKEACCFVQHSVVPSYGDAEGTPVAVLEAQAAGLPVVATRHAGITDAVVDGTTGYLVDERDVAGMANRMVDVLSDRNRAAEMGRAARAHIRENYSIQRHLECLDNLVASARQEAPSRRNQLS